jgi:hypothetical protein
MIHAKELRWRRVIHFTDHLFLVNQTEMQTPRQIPLSVSFFLLAVRRFRGFMCCCAFGISAAAAVVVTLVSSVKIFN